MIRRFANSAKSWAARLMDRAGFLDLLLDRRLSNRVAVIMYHRVIGDDVAARTNSSPGIVVSARQFHDQMRMLRERFNPLSLEEFHSYIEGGTVPPKRSCLVTFDDGWIDNYDFALPTLRRYSIPAVIFLPCQFVSTDRTFWQEEINMRLTHLFDSDSPDKERLIAKVSELVDHDHLVATDNIFGFVASLKLRPPEEIQKILAIVRKASPSWDGSEYYNSHLTWEQIREMRDSNISFASHGLTHTPLTSLTPDECLRELKTSKALIEKTLGDPVCSIAYPNGDFDYNVLKSARDAGYTLGFSTLGGLFDSNSDRLTIPRSNIHSGNSDTPSRFACTVLGIF